MSNASGIRAGRAYVELFADGTKLEAGLRRAQARLRAFGQAMKQAGATLAITGGALMTPFIHAVKTFMDAAKDGKLAGAELGKAITLHQAVRSTTQAITELESAIGAALAPALSSAAQWLTTVVNGLTDWAKANPGTVTAIAALVGGIVVLGGGLLSLGAAINIASWAFGGLAAAASAAFGTIAAVVGTILSPIGAVIAAMGILGYVLVTQTDTGKAALSSLGEGFDRVADDATSAWTGISDALASGDLGLAAQIGLAAVKLEFQRAWSFIQELTLGFLVGINKAFLAVGQWIATTWVEVVGGIQRALLSVMSTVQEIHAALVGGVGSAIAGVGESVGLLPEGTKNQADLATVQKIADMQRAGDTASEQLAADLNRRVADIASQADEIRTSLNEGLADFVSENDATISTLRAQLDALRNQATEGRKKLEEQMKEKGDAATKAAAAVQARAPKDDVFGSFSTAATFGIGIGSTAADRTAKATEDSAKELKAIREKIFTGQTPTFAP